MICSQLPRVFYCPGFPKDYVIDTKLGQAIVLVHTIFYHLQTSLSHNYIFTALFPIKFEHYVKLFTSLYFLGIKHFLSSLSLLKVILRRLKTTKKRQFRLDLPRERNCEYETLDTKIKLVINGMKHEAKASDIALGICTGSMNIMVYFYPYWLPHFMNALLIIRVVEWWRYRVIPNIENIFDMREYRTQAPKRHWKFRWKLRVRF